MRLLAAVARRWRRWLRLAVQHLEFAVVRPEDDFRCIARGAVVVPTPVFQRAFEIHTITFFMILFLFQDTFQSLRPVLR